jgi:hypothetical protein
MAPRRKRLKRPARLLAAKKWISTYGGSNVVHGYKRWFGVDLPCAIAELKLLQVNLDPNYVEQALASYSECCRQRQQAAQKRRDKAQLLANEWPHDHDGNFAFIAGYTSWGFPYGITWEEWNELPDVTPHPDWQQHR